MKWKVLASEYLHREPWLTIRKEKCELPNGQIVPAFYVQEYPEWVNAFALTKDDQVVMVRQYRHGIEETGVELPGGVAEEGEGMEEAVRREIKEETGYEFKSYEYLGKICANPSTTNNFMHMFLATDGVKVADPQLDHLEDLEVVLYSINEVKDMLKENKIMQSLHVNCIFYALQKIGQMQL
ncbi:MAG: NUDIX hydrolase [Chitinophagaceae bacterium]